MKLGNAHVFFSARLPGLRMERQQMDSFNPLDHRQARSPAASLIEQGMVLIQYAIPTAGQDIASFRRLVMARHDIATQPRNPNQSSEFWVRTLISLFHRDQIKY
jgi:hypothetical protein